MAKLLLLLLLLLQGGTSDYTEHTGHQATGLKMLHILVPPHLFAVQSFQFYYGWGCKIVKN